LSGLAAQHCTESRYFDRRRRPIRRDLTPGPVLGIPLGGSRSRKQKKGTKNISKTIRAGSKLIVVARPESEVTDASGKHLLAEH
jgi:hypothetical protein